MSPETTTAFELIGLAWWLVVPIAALACWGMIRLMQVEVFRLPAFPKRGLTWLRGAAVVIVLLFLLEPTWTRTALNKQLPAVALLVDRSGSMAVKDVQQPLASQLDEAVALGLVDGALRPDGARRARRELTALIADLPQLTAALVSVQESWTAGRQPANRDQAVRLAERHAERVTELSQVMAGDAEAVGLFKSAGDVLMRITVTLQRERPDASTDRPEILTMALNDLATRGRTLLPRLDGVQEASDKQLLAGGNSAVLAGLEQLRGMSRLDRVTKIASERLSGILSEFGEVSWHVMDDGELTPISDPTKITGQIGQGATDFAGPLSHLARSWSDQRHVGAVVLLSDGRQTAGVDPVPAIRALQARGALLAGIAVGDPGPIRDAVVSEIQAPAEVFRGEAVRLDVRLRISGYDGTEWRLVLIRNGEEMDQRTIKASGSWQTERFEMPDAEAGVHHFQARLEPINASQFNIVSGGGLLREQWSNIPGEELSALQNHTAYKEGRPDSHETIPQANYTDAREQTGFLVRGYVVPPISGPYRFWISADDRADLFLSTSSDPELKQKIAEVVTWTDAGVYDKFQAQRSGTIVLQKGKPYYIEIVHKQGVGGLHMAVGWTLPDGRVERPIPGSFFAPFGSALPSATKLDDLAEASLANNQADCSVTVNDYPLKVLVIDHSPRWDSRYLVTLFERDQRVQVVRRYHTIRQPQGENELVPPTQAALDAFDVVILGDLAPGEMSSDDQQRLERFVSRRGGFVIAIAGPHGMPASYALGGIANILPVRIVADAGKIKPATVTLTPVGFDHPIMAVLNDQSLNQQLWPVLPPLQWMARGVMAKAGAEVLLTSQDEHQTPVVSSLRFGAGRVLWVGSNESWRWRDRLGDRVHQSFWLQAVRWGLGMRLRGKDARLQAAIDRTLMAPRDSAELRARIRNIDGAAVQAPVHAQLVRLDELGQPIIGSERKMELSPVSDADALYHTRLNNLAEGHWRVVVTCDDPTFVGLSETRDIMVRDRQSQEGIELGADLPGLQSLATAGGFRADTLDQAETLVRELTTRLSPRATPHRTTNSLWDSYWALLLVVSLLSVEWMWRKRVGLP